MAGAAVIAAGDWDDNISDWATQKTPVFGSPESARDASDRLRSAARLGMIVTSVAALTGEDPWLKKVERLALQPVAGSVNSSVTGYLKGQTDRERPDNSDDRSFPSGHASEAFTYATMASRNLDATQLPGPARRAFKVGLTSLAVGTGWARVEGDRHYPSDVLVGAALGNFLARLIHDVFLGTRDDLQVSIEVEEEEVAIVVNLGF